MINNDYTQLQQYVGTQIFDWSTAGFGPPKGGLPKPTLDIVRRDDDELLEIIPALLTRGILN